MLIPFEWHNYGFKALYIKRKLQISSIAVPMLVFFRLLPRTENWRALRLRILISEQVKQNGGVKSSLAARRFSCPGIQGSGFIMEPSLHFDPLAAKSFGGSQNYNLICLSSFKIHAKSAKLMTQRPQKFFYFKSPLRTLRLPCDLCRLPAKPFA